MAEQSEFRIGDVAAAASPRRDQGDSRQNGGLDPDAFPTIIQCIRLSPNEFRECLDKLAARVRGEQTPAVQRALQLATQMLPTIYKNYGGQQ